MARPLPNSTAQAIVSVRRAGTTITKASYHTSVRFVDVNGDEVAKHDVTTDAYGAFHGTSRNVVNVSDVSPS